MDHADSKAPRVLWVGYRRPAASDLKKSGVWLQEPGEHPHESRLPRAVLSEDRVYSPLADLYGDVADGLDSAEALRDTSKRHGGSALWLVGRVYEGGQEATTTATRLPAVQVGFAGVSLDSACIMTYKYYS